MFLGGGRTYRRSGVICILNTCQRLLVEATIGRYGYVPFAVLIKPSIRWTSSGRYVTVVVIEVLQSTQKSRSPKVNRSHARRTDAREEEDAGELVEDVG